MRQLFECTVCGKTYTHPDDAYDCEASHHDATWKITTDTSNERAQSFIFYKGKLKEVKVTK